MTLLIVRVVLAAMLLGAGIAKMFRVAEFSAIVEGFTAMSKRSARKAALGLIIAELVTGSALLSGAGVRSSALLASALFLLFGVVVAGAMLRGQTNLPCGCFGRRDVSVSWKLVFRNGALTCMALALALPVFAPTFLVSACVVSVGAMAWNLR
jgi:hypothetical protein